MEIEILESDVEFSTSPDAGDKDCICSRCLRRITEEQAPVIRAWNGEKGDKSREYRYHITCLS